MFQAKPGSAESDEAEVLALLIKDYEDKHYIIDAPSPIEAIKYRMEQQGLTNKDLAQILGFKSRVSDIHNDSDPFYFRGVVSSEKVWPFSSLKHPPEQIQIAFKSIRVLSHQDHKHN